MWFAIIALVAGCATTHHVHVVETTPSVTFVSSSRAGLDQEARLSEVYRTAWLEKNSGVPGTVSWVKYVSAASAAGSSGAVDMTAECPHDRFPATQAERDACQEADIEEIIRTTGVSE